MNLDINQWEEFKLSAIFTIHNGKGITKEEIEENEGNIIFPAGNALKFLGEYFPKDIKYKNPYDEDPADLRAICFGSNGDILGSNIYEKDIMKIISDYKPKFTDRVKKIIKK